MRKYAGGKRVKSEGNGVGICQSAVKGLNVYYFYESFYIFMVMFCVHFSQENTLYLKYRNFRSILNPLNPAA